jgi:ABC-type transport system involved in cytochrome bd biosynthesis fused ATPase/permease subunit
MAQFSRITSVGISKGVYGAIALSLTFGAVASGRDLSQQDASNQINSAEASASVINRAAKADRATRVAGPAIQTRTISLRLNDLADTSVLIRMPVAREARSGVPASLLGKAGSGRTTLACEPVVSVLTEVAKRLQPGSCVT